MIQYSFLDLAYPFVEQIPGYWRAYLGSQNFQQESARPLLVVAVQVIRHHQDQGDQFVSHDLVH